MTPEPDMTCSLPDWDGSRIAANGTSFLGRWTGGRFTVDVEMKKADWRMSCGRTSSENRRVGLWCSFVARCAVICKVRPSGRSARNGYGWQLPLELQRAPTRHVHPEIRDRRHGVAKASVDGRSGGPLQHLSRTAAHTLGSSSYGNGYVVQKRRTLSARRTRLAHQVPW